MKNDPCYTVKKLFSVLFMYKYENLVNSNCFGRCVEGKEMGIIFIKLCHVIHGDETVSMSHKQLMQSTFDNNRSEHGGKLLIKLCRV
jgi:hypothetical protein